jgi:hypothetical protein
MHNIDLSTLNGGDIILGGLRAHTQAYLCLRDIVRRQENREFVEGVENLLILERENPDVFQDIENDGNEI